MRLVITGILALIILIMICAFSKNDTESTRTTSNPATVETTTEYPCFIPNACFNWKNNFIFPQTVERVFHLSIYHK